MKTPTSPLTDIPDFSAISEQRHAEKAEALRFAKAGLGVHDSELVYADDPRLLEWAKRIPECK